MKSDADQNIPIANENSATIASNSADISENIQSVSNESESSATIPNNSIENRQIIQSTAKVNSPSDFTVIVSSEYEDMPNLIPSALYSDTVKNSDDNKNIQKSDDIAIDSAQNIHRSDGNTSETIATNSENQNIQKSDDGATGSAQNVASTTKSWASMVEDEHIPINKLSISAGDFVEDSEIEQHIQSEKDKLKLYATQIDRFRKDIVIINQKIAIAEHQREISMLNLSIFEASRPEEIQPSEQQVTIPIESRPSSVQSRLKSTSAHSQWKPTQMNSSANSEPVVQCFNCSGFGHKSTHCKAAKRAPGSCFQCGATNHVLKDCPRKAETSEFRKSTRGFPSKQASGDDSDWDDL